MTSKSLVPQNDIDRAIDSILIKDHEPFRHYYLPKLRGERGLASASSSAGVEYELQTLQFCDREMTDNDCERISEALLESWNNFGPERCSCSALRVISVANNSLITNRGVQQLLKVLREVEGSIGSLHTLDFSNIGEPLSETNVKDLVEFARLSPTLRTVRYTGSEERDEHNVDVCTWREKDVYRPCDPSGNALLNAIPAVAKCAVRAAAMCDSGVRTVDLSKPPTTGDLDREFPKTYGPSTTVALLAIAMESCNSVRVLDFSNNNIGDEKTAILAGILKTNTTLLELKLCNNEITTRGALSLFHALRDGPNKTLLELDLTNNGVTDVAVNELVTIIASDVTGLGIVRLERNCTTPALLSRVFHRLAINTQHPDVKRLIPQLEANDHKVSRIGFEKDDVDLDDTSMKVILQAVRQNTHITSIDVSNSRITDEGAFFIAEMMETLPKLRKVICKFNKIGEEGARRLLRAIPKALQVELVDLKFQDPPLSQHLLRLIEKVAGLSAMPKSIKDIGLSLSENNPDITTVDLSTYDGVQRCTDNTVSTLGVLLECNTFVDVVNLANNNSRVTVLSVPIIASFALRLRVLDLSNNGFRDIELASAIEDLLSNPQCRLETLRLAQNDLTNEFSHMLAMTLRNTNDRVISCDVSHNRRVLAADEAEVKYYCDLNTHSKLFKSLIRTMQDDKNPTLKEINLCIIDASVPGGTSNAFKKEFTDLSVKLLCEALKSNKTVQLVNLCGNDITNEGAKTLAAFLRENTTLTHLDVSYNQIGDEGIAAITESIRANTTMKAFVFNNNPIKDPETQRRLIQALQHNNTAIGTAYSTAQNIRAKQQKERGYTTEEDERALDKMIDNAIFVDALKDLKMLEKVRGSVDP
jgi:Ran GTPase-activating protein (RanGAP) involved in mRNA processing and transport